MKEYINRIMCEIEFPPEARNYFNTLYSMLDYSDIELLNKLQSEYFLESSKNTSETNDRVYNALQKHAKIRNFNEYGFCMIFLLYCSKKLESIYYEKNYTKKMFIDLMKDLTSKNNECHKVYNVWGTFVFPWYHRHYLCSRFALGRFQYETITFDKNYNNYGLNLKPGDTVYNLHIPSTGPIDFNSRIKSYKQAYKFYGYNNGKKMPIVCHSWILFPENKYIFNKESNLYSFLQDFEIIYSGVCENAFPNAWRVFNMDYNGNTKLLPSDNSLQKNIIKWLDSGKKIGDGYGILIFDGKKIINNTNLLYR